MNHCLSFGEGSEPVPDLHLEKMRVILKRSGAGLLISVSNWPRLHLEARARSTLARDLKGAVAQLGERLICTQEVAGSIPTSSTSVGQGKIGPVAQMARAHP